MWSGVAGTGGNAQEMSMGLPPSRTVLSYAHRGTRATLTAGTRRAPGAGGTSDDPYRDHRPSRPRPSPAQPAVRRRGARPRPGAAPVTRYRRRAPGGVRAAPGAPLPRAAAVARAPHRVQPALRAARG